MTYESSPNLDGTSPSFPKDISRLIYQYQRAILLVSCGLMSLLIGFLLLRFVVNQPANLSTGGLDGCLVFTTEESLTTSVQVAGQKTNLSPDNCFFFSNLPPGEYLLRVFVGETQAWEQNIQIISGQATGLGEIAIFH